MSIVMHHAATPVDVQGVCDVIAARSLARLG